jgi:hypothetical protein
MTIRNGTPAKKSPSVRETAPLCRDQYQYVRTQNIANIPRKHCFVLEGGIREGFGVGDGN